jgi:sulfate/thiosulfate transport system ATP-binding protein
MQNKGQIEQVGTAAEIYDRPASAFVMSFIGPVNVLSSSADIFQNNGFYASHPQVYLRPQDISIATEPDGKMTVATVTRIINLGWEIQAELLLADGQIISAHLTRARFKELQLQPQQTVYVKPKEAKSFPL